MSKKEPEVIAQRKTYDGYRVLFWNDGAITGGMGHYVRGGKIFTNRMLWAVADEVSLYDWRELPLVLKAARRVEKRKRWTLPELRLAIKEVTG